MDPKATFFCYLGAAACFLLALFGGTKTGKVGEPAALLPLGLLLWLAPTLWVAGQRAF
jgi:hypothetical protein